MTKSMLKKLVNSTFSVIKFFSPSSNQEKKMVIPAKVVEVHSPVNINDISNAVKNKLLTSYQTNDVYIHRLKNAWVTSDGVAFQNWEVFVPSLVWPRYAEEFTGAYFIRNLATRKKKRFQTNETVILAFDHWSASNYYHWIVDTLPRLLVIETIFDKATVLLPESKRSPFIEQTLKAFSFKCFRTIYKSEMVKAGDLVIPGFTANSGLQNPELIKEVRRRLLALYSDNSLETGRKVYVSRSRQRRKIANENELAFLLDGFAYETVFLEDLSFQQQVSVMSNTKILLTPHGANMTNMMFLPEGAIVVELGNDINPNPCYQALANCLQLPYYYFPCHVTGSEEHDDVVVSISKLATLLKQIDSNKARAN